MQNEHELLIEQVLARQEEPDAGRPGRDPNCPDVLLLMARALDQVPPDKEREVDEHSAHCEDCRTLLADHRTYDRDGEVREPPRAGPLLEVDAERRAFVPKRPPSLEDRPPSPLDDNTATNIGSETSISPTSLAHQPRRWPVLLTWLAACLPDLLRAMNLPEQWAEELHAFVTEQLPNLGARRLSDALAVWLARFAEDRGRSGWFTPLTPAMIRSVIAARSTEDVLRQRSLDEPEWASAFREWALRQRPASAKALLALEPEGQPADDNLRAFRRALYQKAEQRYQEYQDTL